MKSPKLISYTIEEFYSQTSEEIRLELGLGPLEFERNKELITRFLPSKGVIIDVGGGPGAYSEWLAKQGYKVHLVDPVLKHIKQASKRAEKLKNSFKCILGEARKLDLPDNFADLLILHGPLYHLQNRKDRTDALKEAKRVLKKGGIVLGFSINYTASTLAGLLNGIIHDSSFFEMCKEELISGRHHAPENLPGILPEAYYHRPAELEAEFIESGLEVINIFAVEGMIWLDKNYFETRSDPAKKELIMNLLRMTETDRSLLALSPHMMIAARKN
ncbi:class I SAM-dependent methyltransferase [Rubrolithibacter danxiaensis]|uniref:class I SAM-dependent methyltransferase n=1 Tax=Rubrolithibacter danxiaensis TaxID=3390805 RepID=UPI003BF897C7